MKVMYLDESGDHNLKKIWKDYPIFVLGGVIVDRAYAREIVDPDLSAFKIKFFKTDEIILHTNDMMRSQNGFEILADARVRDESYGDLNALLEKWDFQILCCVIKKQEMINAYLDRARDPYMYSLGVLVERFCNELTGEKDNGFICAEKRNPGLDRDLLDAWEKLRTKGLTLCPGERLMSELSG